MLWNWQQSDWDDFRGDENALAKLRQHFCGEQVFSSGLPNILTAPGQQLLVDAMSVEASTTSEIEGEILNRASVQFSIQRQLGFLSDRRKMQPAEQGISDLMVDLYLGVHEVLTEDRLFSWHRMVVSGRADFHEVGRHRTSDEPLQVVSGASNTPKVHF
jgi:hypothetical protein